MSSSEIKIEVGRAVLHAEQIGVAKPGQPSLIFLHDALGSVRQWRNFPQQVADATGLSAVVYERQGHGQSSPLLGNRASSYLHCEAEEVLPEILIKLEIEKPILVGFSDGGTIALIHAAHSPVEKVVAIAPHVVVEEVTIQGIRSQAARRDAVLEKLHAYHGDKVEALFSAWADTWSDADFASWNVLDMLPKITCPVLCIQGSEDAYGSELQLELIRDALGNRCQTLFLEGSGHAPHLEKPRLVVGQIASFIAEKFQDSSHQ
jgi:pimeloyl-ACP methyl ester carboxylesterase